MNKQCSAPAHMTQCTHGTCVSCKPWCYPEPAPTPPAASEMPEPWRLLPGFDHAVFQRGYLSITVDEMRALLATQGLSIVSEKDRAEIERDLAASHKDAAWQEARATTAENRMGESVELLRDWHKYVRNHHPLLWSNTDAFLTREALK